jgi:hypothetical protein
VTRSTRLRPLLAGLSLLLLAGGLQQPVSALIRIADVSPARAKELGITVEAQPRANESDIRVQVKFKATGALKSFQYAELELAKDGKRLLVTSLRPQKPGGDSGPEDRQLEFYVDHTLAPDATVLIVASAARGGSGYQLKMKDFLPPIRAQRSTGSASSRRG